MNSACAERMYRCFQVRGICNHIRFEGTHMKFSGTAARRGVAGAIVGCFVGGVAAATIAAPTAAAAPDQCSQEAISGTVSSVTSEARGYLNAHPGADQAVTSAFTKPRGDAAADIRNYFTANPT